MDLTFVNYTGLSLNIIYNQTTTVLSCGSQVMIPITLKTAKYTRFFAKYTNSSQSKIKTKGYISILLDNAEYNPTIILGAFIDGENKYIGCIRANDSGSYIYTTVSKETIEKLYKDIRYYNITVNLKKSSNFWQYIKNVYQETLNPSYCTNRDSIVCDRVVGIPVLFVITLIIVMLACIVVVIIFYQYWYMCRNK